MSILLMLFGFQIGVVDWPLEAQERKKESTIETMRICVLDHDRSSLGQLQHLDMWF